jgi:hypothetical protein
MSTVGAWCSSVVECLPTLGSIPNAEEKTNKKLSIVVFIVYLNARLHVYYFI